MIKLNNTPYGKNRKNFNVLKKFFKKVSKLYELNLDISAKDKRTIKGKENVLKTSFTEDSNDCSLSGLINSYSFMVKYVIMIMFLAFLSLKIVNQKLVNLKI